MGGKGEGIFKNWFKNFAILVFTQAFHAIFLAFIIQMIGGISVEQADLNVDGGNRIIESIEIAYNIDDANKDGFFAIMTIGSMMALIKMEKMIKGLFGISDSKMLGGIGENFAKSMAGIKSGISMAGRTAEPLKDVKTSRDRLRKARMGISDSQDKLNVLNGKKSGAGSAAGIAGTAQSENQQVGQTTSESQAKNVNEGSTNKIAPKEDERQKKLAEAKKALEENKLEEQKAKADLRSAAIKTFTRTGSTAAALGVGLGATDNLNDAVTLSNIIDMGLDKASDRYADKKAYGTAGKEADENLKAARTRAIASRRKEYMSEYYPGLTESAKDSTDVKVKASFEEFEKEFEKHSKTKEFTSQINIDVNAEMRAKAEIDSKIPASTLKEAGKVWKTAATSLSREASKYSREISRDGVKYGNVNIDSESSNVNVDNV
ncbi:MAG: hypothetical protein PHR25_00055 [Clostridia bacterium]|nr:hypothetical protein [Clostridia bacterium]